MRLHSGMLLLVTTALMTPVAAQQAAAPPPQAWRVVETQVAPGQMTAYRQALAGLVKVAEAAKTPNNQRWHTYTSENRQITARPVERNDLLANAAMALRAAQTEMYDKWLAAMPSMSATQLTTLRNEIWIEVPDWSYSAPNAPDPGTGMAMAEVHIAPGGAAAFDSVRKDLVAFRKKIGYPYNVLALRVVLGEPRIMFVTFYDSREAFYGANAMATLVQKANAQAEWDALAARLVAPMAGEWRTSLWNYSPTLSYVPQM